MIAQTLQHVAPAVHASAGDGITVLGILSHTPLWVWAALGYVLVVGWMRTRDRVMAPWRVLVLPAIVTALVIYGLVAGATPLTLLGFASGAVAGALAGLAVARRRPAVLTDDGKLATKGDWLPLALVVGIFTVRYAQGVTLGIDPAIGANPAFVLGSAIVSGLFAAMMVARTLGTLPAAFFRGIGGSPYRGR